MNLIGPDKNEFTLLLYHIYSQLVCKVQILSLEIRLKNAFDNLKFACYVIDKESQIAEIDGDLCLKQLLYEASDVMNVK